MISLSNATGGLMPRRPYDPLAFVPPPEEVRAKLEETLTLAGRLRILLELAERLRQPITAETSERTPLDGKGVSNVA
jgi:hypothetical protein